MVLHEGVSLVRLNGCCKCLDVTSLSNLDFFVGVVVCKDPQRRARLFLNGRLLAMREHGLDDGGRLPCASRGLKAQGRALAH